MCHQVVGLVQAELERAGVATASITLLPSITRKIRPPRALAVPYRLGFPLGEARCPEVQRGILSELLELTCRDDVPLIEPYFKTSASLSGNRPSNAGRIQIFG